MRRRLVLALLTLLFALAMPAAQYMDCYPAKVIRAPNPADTRCMIDYDVRDCLLCTVTSQAN